MFFATSRLPDGNNAFLSHYTKAVTNQKNVLITESQTPMQKCLDILYDIINDGTALTNGKFSSFGR